MLELTLETPTGPVTLSEDAGAIVRCRWGDGGSDQSPLLARAAQQVHEYFQEQRKVFDLPLRVGGSAFQQQVCAQIAAIPFGETLSYGDLAKVLGVSAQAVGRGCGGNPLPILIPCHRVLGRAGLGGFSGGVGVETKVWLLRHEGAAGLLI